MQRPARLRWQAMARCALACALVATVAGCGTFGGTGGGTAGGGGRDPNYSRGGTAPKRSLAPETAAAREVVLAALALLDTGYRFGGKNPEAGLDCSGMVSHVFRQATGHALTGSAADIARRGRPVAADALRPGDLVFFDTQGRPRSHVGIYVGDGRFIHAPSSKGKVRLERLDSGWFAQRFEEARTYFD